MQTLSKKNAILIVLNYGVGYIILYPILLSYFAAFLLQQTGVDYYQTITNIFYIVFFIITFYWGRNLLLNAWVEFKAEWKKILTSAVKNYLLSYVATVLIGFILMFFTTQTTSINQSGIESLLKSTPLSIALFAIIFAPLVEELVFRGVIYNKLTLRYNFYVGMIVSSVLFGLMHVWGSLLTGNFADIIFSLQYIVVGFFIARSYHQTKSFAAPLLFHFIQNSISIILILMLG